MRSSASTSAMRHPPAGSARPATRRRASPPAARRAEDREHRVPGIAHPARPSSPSAATAPPSRRAPARPPRASSRSPPVPTPARPVPAPSQHARTQHPPSHSTSPARRPASPRSSRPAPARASAARRAPGTRPAPRAHTGAPSASCRPPPRDRRRPRWITPPALRRPRPACPRPRDDQPRRPPQRPAPDSAASPGTGHGDPLMCLSAPRSTARPPARSGPPARRPTGGGIAAPVPARPGSGPCPRGRAFGRGQGWRRPGSRRDRPSVRRPISPPAIGKPTRPPRRPNAMAPREWPMRRKSLRLMPEGGAIGRIGAGRPGGLAGRARSPGPSAEGPAGSGGRYNSCGGITGGAGGIVAPLAGTGIRGPRNDSGSGSLSTERTRPVRWKCLASACARASASASIRACVGKGGQSTPLPFLKGPKLIRRYAQPKTATPAHVTRGARPRRRAMTITSSPSRGRSRSL